MDDNKPYLVSDGPALDRAGLIHRLRTPQGSEPHRALIMLHGRSGDENVMWVFSSLAPKNWLLASPRGPKSDVEGGYAWLMRRRGEWPALSGFDEAVTAVERFIQATIELYGADPNHIYLMGFSQGAALAYATAIRRPGRIKGVAGLVGFMPADSEPALNAEPLKNVPVFVAAGKDDPFIPLDRSRACADALRRAGASLDYREYEAGHKLTADALRDLRAWWRARTAQ